MFKTTLQEISGNSNIYSLSTKCDCSVVDFVWENVNENPNVLKQVNLLPMLLPSKNNVGPRTKNVGLIPVKYPDKQNTVKNNYIDNNFIDYDENNYKYLLAKRNRIYKNHKSIAKKSEFPKNAPFLVAIFETITNITAQTCGGTLLSSHWVLTAASCLNLLSSFYNNM